MRGEKPVGLEPFKSQYRPQWIHSPQLHRNANIFPEVSQKKTQAPAPLYSPLGPNFPTTPFLNPSVLSISSAPFLCTSLIIKTCLMVTTSKKLRPGESLLPRFSNSSSASRASLDLAVSRATAGLLAGEGKMVCEGALADGWKFDDAVGLGRRVCDCARGWERGVDAGRRAEVLKVEELERVGEGWTGPSCERRALKAKSGSEASRVIAKTVSRQLRSPLNGSMHTIVS